MKALRSVAAALLLVCLMLRPALGFSANTPNGLPGINIPTAEGTPHLVPHPKTAPPRHVVPNHVPQTAIPNNVPHTLFRPVTVSNPNDDGAPAGFVAMLAVVVVLAMLTAFYYLNKRD